MKEKREEKGQKSIGKGDNVKIDRKFRSNKHKEKKRGAAEGRERR